MHNALITETYPTYLSVCTAWVQRKVDQEALIRDTALQRRRWCGPGGRWGFSCLPPHPAHSLSSPNLIYSPYPYASYPGSWPVALMFPSKYVSKLIRQQSVLPPHWASIQLTFLSAFSTLWSPPASTPRSPDYRHLPTANTDLALQPQPPGLPVRQKKGETACEIPFRVSTSLMNTVGRHGNRKEKHNSKKRNHLVFYIAVYI